MRAHTLAVAAREYVWLWDHRDGKSTQEIADRENLSERRVRFGLARARSMESPSATFASATAEQLRPPRLVALFPIAPFTPLAGCPHRGPIRTGSVLCCMVCHQSGIDGHPAMKRDPVSDPKPEKKPAPPAAPTGRETRKQRRARVYGAERISREMAREKPRTEE